MSKDCFFVMAWYSQMLVSVLFIVCFASKNWVEMKEATEGLWQWCNVTEPDLPECHNTGRVEGGFLDLTRTFACFSLVAYIIGLLGYMVSDHRTDTDLEGKSFKEYLKFRAQEIAHFIAGAMLAGVLPQYGLNYHEHYSRTYDDVELGWCFYMAAVCSGLSLLCSICIYITRDTGFRFSTTKKRKIVNKTPAKGVGIEFKGTRKDWLMNKNVPIPLDQKKDTTPAVVEVEVKRGKVHSVVAPTMVILAMKRLKNGKARAELARETKDPVIIEDRSPTPPDNNDKYKGIFTVQVDNTQNHTPTPPLPPPPAYDSVTKRRPSSPSSESLSSHTSSSSSSSDGNVSVELEATAKGGDASAAAAAAAAAAPRPPIRKHMSQMESSLRANVRPSMARRHTGMTENTAHMGTPVAQGAPSQDMDLYAIPPEPGTQQHSQSVSAYEEVVVDDTQIVPLPVHPTAPAVQKQFY